MAQPIPETFPDGARFFDVEGHPYISLPGGGWFNAWRGDMDPRGEEEPEIVARLGKPIPEEEFRKIISENLRRRTLAPTPRPVAPSTYAPGTLIPGSPEASEWKEELRKEHAGYYLGYAFFVGFLLVVVVPTAAKGTGVTLAPLVMIVGGFLYQRVQRIKEEMSNL